MATSSAYPFTKVPKGQTVDMTKIHNPLDRAKLANPTVKKLEDIVQELENNPDTMTYINGLKANKQKFDPKEIGKVVLAPVKTFTFNEITQRLIDIGHCHTDILTKLNPRLLSPVFATKQADGTNSCFDTQHGIAVVGLLAKHGLWGNDPKDWLDFEFPAFIVDEPHPSFTPEAALHRNGKGQKKWEPYDHHKIKVAAVRQHNNPSQSKEYADSDDRQTICEKYEAIPLPKGHGNFGHAGTLSRSDVIYDWSLESLEFILKTHKQYWHGTLVDSATWGLYGNLVEHMILNNFPTTGATWDQFLDDFNATIFECFTDLATLRTATERAYTKYFRKAFPNLKNVPSCPHNAALSVIMKIYQRAGGKYYLTGDVFDYMQNGCDIYDELDADILKVINDAIN